MAIESRSEISSDALDAESGIHIYLSGSNGFHLFALDRLDTFTTYLESNRRVAEIQKMYYNKGERSVKEAANLVGLELPKTK